MVNKIILSNPFFLFFILVSNIIYSQTIISPTGDGGFETGTTFAANGWAAVNVGNASRNWYVGTGQPGFTGTRCAFIGNSATLVGTNTSARIQHFYRSITVPAGATNIQLSFKYKQAAADFIAPTYYDYIAVYTNNTTPPVGALPAGGTLAFGPYPNTNITTFTTQNVTLPNALAGTTTNLIFTFVCDALAPNGYGAIDDVSLTCTPAPSPPTITNLLSASAGCEGSNITITGTNLTGATAANVKIGGTPVSSITSNNGTTLVAVVGVGTTGTVSVTTAGGAATSVGTFTVNPLPAAIGGGAVAICLGVNSPAFTNASSGGIWSITNGTGTATITTGGVVSGLTAGTVTVNYTLPTTCTRTAVLTINRLAAAITGGATSVCVGASTPAFTNTATGGIWSVVNGTGTATITAAGILTGTAVGTVTVNYTFGGCPPKTYSVTVNPVPTSPTAPINSAITGSSFTVTWTPSAGAANYVLEVYTNAGYTGPQIAGSPFSIASPTVTYNVTGLSGPVTYYYRIKASNGSCESSYVTGSVTTLLSNDDCSGAIPLSISSTCSYSFYTNVGATASAGVPAPGCTIYGGGDVWFSALVPASGELTVDLQSGTITDSGMAFYSGTCGALTLLECDDDDSNNGLMSYISMTGLTPGQTIYIRVWEYENDTTGTFGICATTPSCPSPSDLFTNILNNTSVTINWNASTPPASGGYQYFINTTGVAPIASTAPTGSTAAGVNGVTLTVLTPGLKYYFWVRSFCGGSDNSYWFGPTNYTPCAVGNGTGTTTLDCPSVISGGLGLNGASPPAMSCQALSCVDLEATYLQIKQPTDYSVTSIPYAPPYQFRCLQNSVSVNVDDIWSPMINLPFNFCFYGNNYNRCLIGSNGVITFDTTTYAPGGYNNWAFNNNLPNASLFKNTIFGVYQDIDPSRGGQVGWELITLNTGCRALVAAWNDIPMFSSTCNSQLYTGMIVLYENTNVIEVYIKEKNTCATWNSGNAIVGIQNSTGTAAVVAPNRNGLSPDWAITEEAWRFTPTGTSLTTLKWFEGNSTSGTQIGTSDTINVCPTATTIYTAEVTYALCSGTNLKYTNNVVVTVNGNKIWNGNQSTDWNTSNNWTPGGVPTNANCVLIPNTTNKPVISSVPDGVGYNLAVYNGAQLTVNSNQNLTITDKVTVQPTGIFTINNSASLIQINNVLNSGNIIYKRDSPNIRTLDYVYWSSPVAGFNVNNIVLPYSFGGIYKWNTTLANTNGGQGGWQSAAGSIMTPGKGFIARSPGTSPFNNTTFNVLSGTFTGVPNNGNISIPIERGNDENLALHFGTNGTQITNLSDNWNLIGNPYPSAIRGSQFLFDNRTKIVGNIRLWSHGTLPSVLTPSPFYGSFLSNYTPGDYLTYNFTGTSCCPAAADDIFIGAGQGFFVQMSDGPAVSSANNIMVDFNNNLRSATFSNSTFYKNQNPTTSSVIDVDSIERNRIWLDFITPNNQTDRILFGYIENATMGSDSFYDCITQNNGAPTLYTLVDDTKFSIQGRSLPFDVYDEVSVGFNATTLGNYTIGITAVDGLFNNQDVYLKDILLNITHDLKAAPYIFTTQPGEINDRFKIVYVDGALGNPSYTLDNIIKVMVNNEVAVSSSNLEMESITVYNLLGQKLDTYNNINSNYTILSNLRKNNTTLLLNIKLQTGEIITKKIIY